MLRQSCQWIFRSWIFNQETVCKRGITLSYFREHSSMFCQKENLRK